MQIVVSTDIIKHVLVKHCIQHCLGLQLKFAWGEEWKENQRTCTRELVPLTLISSLGCFKKEEKKKKQRLDIQLRMWRSRKRQTLPWPLDWLPAAQQSSEVCCRLLGGCGQDTCIAHTAVGDRGALLNQGLSCHGKTPGPFPKFMELEK